MTSVSAWIICEHCDSVYRQVELSKHHVSRCIRCKAVLDRGGRLTIQQHLALTVGAGFLFVFANAFPVISIGMQGLSNQANLWQSVTALAHGQISAIAVVAGLAIILAPLLQITLLCWLLTFALRHRAAPGFIGCMRVLEGLRPWSMLEVCLLGILVSIVKLDHMLDVHPGVGLWALGMLTLLIILISGESVHRLWDDLEGDIP